jgi:hypothetical protein
MREKIEDIVKRYYELNESKKEFEKFSKNYRSSILDYLSEENVDNRSCGEYEIKRSIREKKSVDEEKLIQILQQTQNKKTLDKVLKTKIYVDDDKLEELLYNEIIDPRILAPAQEIKKEVVLQIIKKEKK